MGSLGKSDSLEQKPGDDCGRYRIDRSTSSAVACAVGSASAFQNRLATATARERSCWCRGLLLRCLAETREHRRSPGSVRMGWSQIRAYSEPECRTADRLWSSALPGRPRPLAARFLLSFPVERAAGLD